MLSIYTLFSFQRRGSVLAPGLGLGSVSVGHGGKLGLELDGHDGVHFAVLLVFKVLKSSVLFGYTSTQWQLQSCYRFKLYLSIRYFYVKCNSLSFLPTYTSVFRSLFLTSDLSRVNAHYTQWSINAAVYFWQCISLILTAFCACFCLELSSGDQNGRTRLADNIPAHTPRCQFDASLGYLLGNNWKRHPRNRWLDLVRQVSN